MLTKHLEPKQLCQCHGTPSLLKVGIRHRGKTSEPLRVLAASAGRHLTFQPAPKSTFIFLKYVTSILSFLISLNQTQVTCPFLPPLIACTLRNLNRGAQSKKAQPQTGSQVAEGRCASLRSRQGTENPLERPFDLIPDKA